MDSFDFDRLNPIALEQTLSYLDAFPEPQDHDVSFLCQFADAVAEKDWLAESPPQERADQAGIDSQSRSKKRLFNREWNVPNDVMISANQMPHTQSCAWTLCTEPAVSNALSKKKLCCTWHECQHIPSSDGELACHLQHHAEEVVQDWSPPSRCMWKGCQSKETFKSSKSYKHHLINKHTDPLMCTVPGCSCKKPFRGKGDLDRHKATAHLDIRCYVCPFDECAEEGIIFPRKDKWLKHIRETPHENDAFCPYIHCKRRINSDSIGFKTREEIVAHFKTSHLQRPGEAKKFLKPSNCALGSCAWNHKSEHWGPRQLDEHLRAHHGVPFNLASEYACMSKLEGTAHFLRAEYLDQTARWHDCTICNQQQQPQQDIQIRDQIYFPGADVTGAPLGYTAT